jgi:hypothetical protein
MRARRLTLYFTALLALAATVAIPAALGARPDRGKGG